MSVDVAQLLSPYMWCVCARVCEAAKLCVCVGGGENEEERERDVFVCVREREGVNICA